MGRELLRQVVTALGNRRIILRYTWNGFATDFDKSSTLKAGAGQLNVAANLVTTRHPSKQKSLQQMLQAVKAMEAIHKTAQKRLETTGRNMSLKIEGVWTTSHEVHIGVPTKGKSPKPVLFASPHYVTVAHELCCIPIGLRQFYPARRDGRPHDHIYRRWTTPLDARTAFVKTDFQIV